MFHMNMKSLYLFLAKHQKIVKQIFFGGYVSLALLYIAGLWVYPRYEELRPFFGDIGAKFGELSIILLLISMTPGILKRLNILRQVESLLLIFRRQIGITAFFTAMLHSGFISLIKQISTGKSIIPTLFVYNQTGFAALSIFFLLWVISNNYSMKTLGSVWKLLQRLTYVAALAIMLHVFDARSKWWMVVGAYLVFEAISWTIFLFRQYFTGKKPVI